MWLEGGWEELPGGLCLPKGSGPCWGGRPAHPHSLTLDHRHTSCLGRARSGERRFSLGALRKAEEGRCRPPPVLRGRKNWKEWWRPSM